MRMIACCGIDCEKCVENQNFRIIIVLGKDLVVAVNFLREFQRRRQFSVDEHLRSGAVVRNADAVEPCREVLFGLERDGFVVQIPHTLVRGLLFVVVPTATIASEKARKPTPAAWPRFRPTQCRHNLVCPRLFPCSYKCVYPTQTGTRTQTQAASHQYPST